jgi:hypothetical protein
VQPSGGFDIRVATPDDATAICTVQTRTWLATYPSEELGITREGLRRHLEGEHGERIADRIARTRMRIEGRAAEPDGGCDFVAALAAEIVGFTVPFVEPGYPLEGGTHWLETRLRGYGMRKGPQSWLCPPTRPLAGWSFVSILVRIGLQSRPWLRHAH